MDANTAEPEPESLARLYYLDWLRVIALLGVAIMHSLQAFLPNFNNCGDICGFVADEQSLPEQIDLFILLMSIPFMSVFFLISGAAATFALRRRNAWEFLKERTLRILLPFVVGSLLIWPYVKWLVPLNSGDAQAQDGAIQYYRYWLTQGAFDAVDEQSLGFAGKLLSSIAIFGGHLWFLGFLFLISVIVLPVLLWLHSPRSARFLDFASQVAQRRG